MSKPNLSSEVVLPWGDGNHLFALKGKQIEHLEKACDAGIAELANRVMSLRPRYGDLYQIILLGLEGGGMPPTQAKAMMDRYFEGRPIADPRDEASPLATAAKVMQAVWFGMEDIPSGEAGAGETPAAKPTSPVTAQPSSTAE
ncbi:gene transfer agent family protein [Mesorhizobium sp. M0938]|uniref:gene transfer agent family protein n=1 Tax=unclassified Mesorhizobium TaxID=325217 RepID=UPI0033358F38